LDGEWLLEAIEERRRLRLAGFNVISKSTRIARGSYMMRNVEDLHCGVNEELKRSRSMDRCVLFLSPAS